MQRELQRQLEDDLNRSWSSSTRPPTPSQHAEYQGWSHDFVELCHSQLSLLASTVAGLSQVLLFFRHENPTTGALEFVPLVVHTVGKDDPPRVWISSGAAGQTELEEGAAARVLPGGIPAAWILPDYPFKPVGEQGGILMPDGGMCVPVEYNGVLAGSVVLCPEGPGRHTWEPEDVKRADMVAKSIALGAALEGKWHANSWLLGTGRSLIDSMRSLLTTTLHQVRSPVSALVTFGHLLLRKLPPGDSNRALAKNIILEALRVNDLLKPLDEAGVAHVLPEAVDGAVPWYQKGEEGETLPEFSGDYVEVPKPSLYAKEVSTNGMQLLWLSDVLQPQADISEMLATEKGMRFVADIDDDSPPVLAVEKYIREAVSSLVDNSLKYSPPGSHVGISFVWSDDDDQTEVPEDDVNVVVWDTGYGFSDDEIDDVWDFGYRGSAAVRSGAPGSGIGLSAVRQMLEASGAVISLQSPLPAYLDPRKPGSTDRASRPGSAFTLQFKRPSR